MIVWRIATDAPDDSSDDLSGKGAEISAGRWNRKGAPVVYCSGTVALAVLETIVHLDFALLPYNRYLCRIEIPDDVWQKAAHFDPAANVGWDAEPAGKVSLDFGASWLASNASAIAVVPSVIVLEEVNILINPRHPDAGRIPAKKIRKFFYDRRFSLARTRNMPARR